MKRPRARPAGVRVGIAAAVVTLALVGLPAAAGATGSAPTVPLDLFVHARGGWSSHTLSGVAAGVGTPSIAASRAGVVVVAQRTATGDVTVAEGRLSGAFTATDLTASIGAPASAGRPTAFVAPTGAVSVWYRTITGDLEVLSEPSTTGSFSATDVTAATGATPLAGDPTVVASGAGAVGYAVTQLGTVVAFAPPASSGTTWSISSPTGALAYPPLGGDVAVLRAPGRAAATVLLAVARTGDVVELSDELAGSPPTVGPWVEADLTSLGVPPAEGTLAAAAPTVPFATYTAYGGDVVALSVGSGLIGGVAASDLTRLSYLTGASGASPSVVPGVAGGAIAVRTMEGDLLVASIARPTSVSDLSFEPHTAEHVAGDAAAVLVGGALVLVAADGGPIAPTPLERRIALIATAYDQQHRAFQTDPHGSYCNPFTAAFGRGWTAGCPAGYAAEEWCSDFAQYVWRAAGIPTGGITGWAATFVTWGVKHHRAQLGTHFDARVGDAIVWGTRAPLYGQHVGIVVWASGRYLDVVSGDSGGDFPGYGIGVWRWGAFVGATSRVLGYPVLAVVQP